MVKKALKSLMALFLVMSLATGVSAAGNEMTNSQIEKQKQEFYEFKKALKEHADDLILTDKESYKEIKLANGYTLFAEAKLKKGLNNTQIRTSIVPFAQQTNELETSQGYKNMYGMVVIQLDTYTRWTFDYDKVLSGYTIGTPIVKMIPWQVRRESVNGPDKGPYEREWTWTANATFSYNVAGVELDNITLINDVKAKYNGEYGYRYRSEG